MTDLTTAQRLAAYRSELIEAGFTEAEAADFVKNAAPGLVEDVRVKDDQDRRGARF